MKNKTMHKLPKTIIKEFHIDPEQGVSPFVRFAPAGYFVQKIDRKKSKAIITYELI